MLKADKYLKIINDRGKRSLPLKRVYHNMRQPGLFYKAYENLYSNRGALTAGVDPKDTVQGMSVARIEAIIQQLAEGSYQWQPARRTYVPKANGQQRPISIPGWSDKMVQEVIRQILEVYYEPQFRNSSHGFRPNRSCFTALKQIKETWTGTKWFVEGDIHGCFDNIPKHLILQLLGQNIQDNRFLKLIKDMLEAGYMEDWRYHSTLSGVPQGGICSPVLSNLVLNELDKWIEDELIPQYTQGQHRHPHPEYKRLINRRSYAKQKGQWAQYTQLGKNLRHLPSKDPYDPNFERLRYVRLADDFLLGYIGPKAKAKQIKQQISHFLQKLGLTLSQDKTLITHAHSETARFLGYEIRVSWSNSKLTDFSPGQKMRSVNGKIYLSVPQSVATKWMRRYCTAVKPRHTKWLLVYSAYGIVTLYGAQLRGLTNYYQLAPNISQRLKKVYWACVQSCRKTLTTKHKLSTPKSYQRYYVRPKGERNHIQVIIDRPDKKPLIAKCGERSLKHQPNATYANDEIPPFQLVGRQRELTKRLLAEQCESCRATNLPLEAHHINKLANLKRRWQGRKHKPEWVKWMLARRRKTIFVCRQCHQDITYGRYDGEKLR
jgi:group II intron reverse transcriptase/maturase